MSKKNKSEKKTQAIDFLSVDKEIRGQKYVALSFLTPNTLTMSKENEKLYSVFKENIKSIIKEEFIKFPYDEDTYLRFKDLVCSLVRPEFVGLLYEKSIKFKDFYGIKVRGSFEERTACDEHCKKLYEIDSSSNAYTGDVGKWLPLDDNPERAEHNVWGNDELNEFMQSHLEQQEKANMMFEKRKTDMKLEAIKKTNQQIDNAEKKKKKNKVDNSNNEEKNVKEIDSLRELPKTGEKVETSDKEMAFDELEKELEKAKSELNKVKNETNNVDEEFKKANDTYKYLNKKVNEQNGK